MPLVAKFVRNDIRSHKDLIRPADEAAGVLDMPNTGPRTTVNACIDALISARKPTPVVGEEAKLALLGRANDSDELSVLKIVLTLRLLDCRGLCRI